MAVAQGVPLPVADDRVEGVELEQQHPAGPQPGGALGQRRRLVRRVHHPEAVDDHVCLGVAGHLGQAAGRQQIEPGPAVRAAVLGDPRARGQQAGGGNPADRVRRLGDEGGRLGAPWLLRHGRIGQQLGQAAIRAEPHLQRVNRIGLSIVIFREVVAGRLLTEIENNIAAAVRDRPGTHNYPFRFSPRGGTRILK